MGIGGVSIHGSSGLEGPACPAGHSLIGDNSMHRDLDHEADGVRECEPWDRVVGTPPLRSHRASLSDQDFSPRRLPVCRAGFANGEGIILVSTLTHWKASAHASRPRASMYKRRRNADS